MNNTNLVYSVLFGTAKWSSSATHVSIKYLIPHSLVDQTQMILQFKNRKWMFQLTRQMVHLYVKIQMKTLNLAGWMWVIYKVTSMKFPVFQVKARWKVGR